MAPVERKIEIAHCPSCDRVELDGEPTCCNERLETIDTTAVFEPPKLEEIAQQIFGATPLELDICDVLMAEGEASVSTLTDQFSHNRSTIFRHLNHLVERGMVTKRSEALEEGGQVDIYSCVPPDEIRRKLKISLYIWTQEAMELTDERIQAKIEAAEQTDETTTGGSNADTISDTTRAAGNSEAESNVIGDSVIDRLFHRD